MSVDDNKWMGMALELAREAAAAGEVPVGCVIVRNGCVVGQGRNRREEGKSALAHAEVEAIADACRNLGGWRLWDCTMYVTLEPCPMCAGAIVNSRIERVVYGAPDHKAGAFGTMLNLTDYPLFKPEIVNGVLKDDCAKILSDFFKKKR